MQDIVEVRTPTGSDVAHRVVRQASGWQVWHASQEEAEKPTGTPDEKELEGQVKLHKEIIEALFADYGAGIQLTVGSVTTGSVAWTLHGEESGLLQAARLSGLWHGEPDRQTESLSDGSGVIRLCDDDFDSLVAMLDEDREPTPALLRAGKRYKELVGW